ncbi:hypothetical protein C8K18_11438 [Paraburkholderia sp. GV068]|nr:hypothetical protein C8K19_110238 [Paraburkholderia sp. GV072]PUB00777.1 hypothetical protein C8K18_11438 [Paraburkholderia sp. GV068]
MPQPTRTLRLVRRTLRSSRTKLVILALLFGLIAGDSSQTAHLSVQVPACNATREHRCAQSGCLEAGAIA